jgi:hypothetical protein
MDKQNGNKNGPLFLYLIFPFYFTISFFFFLKTYYFLTNKDDSESILLFLFVH